MKVISMITIIVMAWTAPAFSGISLLTDSQMDSVVAGSESVDVDILNVTEQEADGGVLVSEDPASFIINDDVAAQNLVNLSETIVDNSVLNDNSVNVLVFADDAQKEIKAVNVTNTIGGKIAIGINALAAFYREPGSSSSGLDSPFAGVNQSNIIIQKP
jgi:hypothetical protein